MTSRRLLKGLVATLITLGLALLLCEAILWIIGFPTPAKMDEREIVAPDDELGYRLHPDMALPGMHTPYFTHPEIRTNSLGLRNTEVMTPKPSGVFRILSLGDSYAFGWGVKSEDTYARRLEALLSERSAVTRVEVINAGVPSYASWRERQLLDQLLETLTPDLVICQVVDDDLGPSPARVKAYEQLVPGWIRNPLRHSRVFGMTWAFFYEGTSGVRSILAGDATRQRRLNREELWDVMEASVTEVDSGLVYDRDRLASYVDDYAAMHTQSGRKLVVLILPNRYQIYAGGYLSAGYNWLARALENESVPSLNATRFLRKHRDTELCLEDAHPNALAHSLIADTLAAFLIAKGFLPPAPARVLEHESAADTTGLQ